MSFEQYDKLFIQGIGARRATKAGVDFYHGKHLCCESVHFSEQQGRRVVHAAPYVTFVTCPDLLTDDLPDISAEELWGWLEPNSRRYQPDPGAIFMLLNNKMNK
jgi:hypothetical protein